MAEKVTWESLVKLAETIRKRTDKKLTDGEIKENKIKFDKYVEYRSGEPDMAGRVRWLDVDPSFYRRLVMGKEEKRRRTSPDVTKIFYKISKTEKCPAEEVCDTLTTLGVFSEKTVVDLNLLDKLKGDNSGVTENLNSGNIKENVSMSQEGLELPEKCTNDMEPIKNSGVDENRQGNNVELSVERDKCLEDSIEDTAKDVQPDIPQCTSTDNALEITEEDLKTFVIGFIESMSYKIEALYLREHSSCSELYSICLDESCIDELTIFHKDINPRELVLVTYFTSSTLDEEIQQEIERIHKLEKRPKAFVIIACTTDEMFKYVKENIGCDRQKSIMILCCEHPDEAYIRLRGDKKSDERKFEFSKSDSKKYIYI